MPSIKWQQSDENNGETNFKQSGRRELRGWKWPSPGSHNGESGPTEARIRSLTSRSLPCHFLPHSHPPASFPLCQSACLPARLNASLPPRHNRITESATSHYLPLLSLPCRVQQQVPVPIILLLHVGLRPAGRVLVVGGVVVDHVGDKKKKCQTTREEKMSQRTKSEPEAGLGTEARRSKESFTRRSRPSPCKVSPFSFSFSFFRLEYPVFAGKRTGGEAAR